ncbi:MAG: glycosyltransferase family 4 protein [Chloroflexota bacterium]|nr:glycosyltransferase family 4 protein [Chloroflexota bacterium]
MSRPLRVLIVSRCPPHPLTLGDRLIVHHLARELGARGHTLDLLAFDDGAAPPDPDAYRHLFRTLNVFPDPPRGAVRTVRRLLQPSARFPIEVEECASPDMWRAIRRTLTTQPPDIVHFFGGVSVYEYANAAVPFPALITPYESYSLYLDRAVEAGGGLVTRARRWAAEHYESWMFAPYKRVVVLTARDREALRSLNPLLPLEVIPNGVDLTAFAPDPTIAPQPHSIVFTGNFAYPPNRDAALFLIREILPRVQAHLPGATLHLVGANPPDDLLDYAADDLIVTGEVPDLRPYLARAAVYACPLRVGAGIKNKVLEALAMRCAVVATPLSLDGIAVRDGESILIADADPELFTSAVIRVLTDAPMRDRLRIGGRAVIENSANHYRWDAVAARYEALYLDILRESGRL